VYRGEIQARALGCKVEAFDEDGHSLVDQVGELVITEPMPSMPLFLWDDAEGERYRESYFDMYPGIWRHGPKAVFFGRWIAGLRIWASWLAGMTTMPWRSFLVWNALGGITWALWFGLLGYFGGEAAAHVVARAGVGVAIVVVSGFVAAYAIMHLRLRRRRRAGEPAVTVELPPD
jgi:hypothetical protein